ncbi:hypothetical protein NC652_037987 [Populus alba x Populus x berolinensis]|uniref:Uncharacterized protein n=2 Tax=Populus TaxID=3689 RepID=A0ACC4APK9_POPAL|nr:hypothetical protein NC652_037987 [Populus alba x Populus x berolinensis]KAJ6960134.1 hypothetical protein NC653_038237 [Populus alba x Populus x berolinensis]
MATTESLVAQIQGLSSNAVDFVIAVSKRFKDQVLMLDVPMRGVAPLLEAVKKLRTSSEHLTALHPDFLQLCLLENQNHIGSADICFQRIETSQD